MVRPPATLAAATGPVRRRAGTAPVRSASGARLFGEVTRTEARSRALRRGAWIAGSLLLQTVLVAGILALPARRPLSVDDGPIVEVKFVKGAPRPLAAPPPPTVPRKKVAPRPVAAPAAPELVQPKDVPAEPIAPDPDEPSGPEDEGPAIASGAPDGIVGGASGGSGTPTRLEFNDAMTRPVFVSGPDPEYTKEALERGVTGLMVVKCVITVEGTVHDCRVLSGLPFMDRAIVEALERRRYRPATFDGKPLEVNYTFRIRLLPNYN